MLRSESGIEPTPHGSFFVLLRVVFEWYPSIDVLFTPLTLQDIWLAEEEFLSKILLEWGMQ